MKTAWNTSGSGPVYTKTVQHKTTGNFPIHFMVAGGSPGLYCWYDGNSESENSSTITGSWNESANNNVSLKQQLIFGDDVIVTGSSSMEYSMSSSGQMSYSGRWRLVCITETEEAEDGASGVAYRLDDDGPGVCATVYGGRACALGWHGYLCDGTQTAGSTGYGPVGGCSVLGAPCNVGAYPTPYDMRTPEMIAIGCRPPVFCKTTRSMDQEMAGKYEQSEDASATATRNVHTFEVVDYDNYNGNYAIIYKDINITHTQVYSVSREGTPYDGDVYIQLGYSNGNLPASALVMHNTSEDFVSQGTRDIDYILYYNIDGAGYSRKLASVHISSDMSVYSVDGERVYGVSMQMSKDYLVYSFELHDSKFSGTVGYGSGYNYDSPRSVEDWNRTDTGEEVWRRCSQVIGLVNIASKKSDLGYAYEQKYDLLSKQQFAVGLVGI
jgi:hypothetical protein